LAVLLLSSSKDEGHLFNEVAPQPPLLPILFFEPVIKERVLFIRNLLVHFSVD